MHSAVLQVTGRSLVETPCWDRGQFECMLVGLLHFIAPRHCFGPHSVYFSFDFFIVFLQLLERMHGSDIHAPDEVSSIILVAFFLLHSLVLSHSGRATFCLCSYVPFYGVF